MSIDYENLLLIVVVADLNLTKFGVGWFERVLEIEYCEMEEMRWCLLYNNVTWVNWRWYQHKLTHVEVIL